MPNTSLVADVLALVQHVREQRRRVQESATVERAAVLDMLEDIVCKSDALMSSMLSAPLTGRMFVATDVGVTPEMCEASLQHTLLDA